MELLTKALKNQKIKKKPQNNYSVQKVFILGIGNPEEKYNNTRHNIGKDWVEKIAKDHELTFVKKSKLRCSICEVEPHVYLVVPDVYVNETGRVALLLKRYLNAKPEQILVLHDDIDTQIGKVKFKSGGGDGGGGEGGGEGGGGDGGGDGGGGEGGGEGGGGEGGGDGGGGDGGGGDGAGG